MRKYIVFSLVGMMGFIHQTTYAEVYDMDALTDGYNENTTTSVETNTNATNKNTPTTTTPTETTNQELNLAECIIYQKLEIEDAQCDKLMSSFSCPEYADSLDACEAQYQHCVSNLASYSSCVATYKSCTDLVASSFPVCAKQYPPRQVTGDKVTAFQLTEATGDVRVFYEDDPTPLSMEAVTADRAIQAGAALFTGDKGSVTLQLPNGVKQVVGPNTYFRIADYYASDRLMSVYTQLPNGNVQVRIDAPDSTQVSYVVITPLWKVSAKGTEFEVSVNDDGTQLLTVTSGAVELVDLFDGTTRTVSAGETFSSEESDTELLDLESDYTLTSKLQHFWSTQRWAIILGGLGIVALVVGGIIWLVVRRHRA